MDSDKILGNILQTELSLNNGRIVLYNKNFKSPKDAGLYIIISTGPDKIISSTNKFDEVTEEQIQKVIKNTTYNIEITSKNNEAKEIKDYVLMALSSYTAIRYMEDNNVRIFRTPTIQDLSFIEGSSSLHRYRIPVIINQVKVKRTSIDCFDNFQDVEVEHNE